MSAEQIKLISKLIFISTLSACGSTETAHYKDNELLERPPILAIDRQSELAAENEADSPQPDESVVSTAEDRKKGMGDKVYLTDSTPPALKIKQPFAGAWNTVEQALIQREIKITDHEKDKGLYYVAYDNRGFLDHLGSFFKSDDKGSIYLLTLTDDDNETKVIASLANPVEQDSSGSQDGHNDGSADDHAAELLQILYQTMRDDLVKK